MTLSEGAAALLHRLTSYDETREWTEPAPDERVRQDLEVNDPTRLPPWHKVYEAGLEVLPLPRELPPTTAPATAVLAGTAQVAPAGLDLVGLARLLFLTAGVVRTATLPGGTMHFRAAGSAGARYPLELYVAVPAGGSLPSGVHWYDPEAHALVRVGPPPSGSGPVLVVTGVPWRTGWRYRERGFRHVYWDAGTSLAQVLALADSAGLPAALHTRFPDAAVADLVGADRVHEFPVAVVALGARVPDVIPSGTTVLGQLDAEPLEFPLVTGAQRAGDLTAWGPAWVRGAPVETTAPGPPVEEVIRTRGSARRMDPTRSLPLALLRESLAIALRGVDLPHFVAVHAVDGLVPGIYRWPQLDAPLRRGDLRHELFRLCLEQGLARDAAFVVLGAVDVAALDDHAYREAQLGAGLVEGRLHLLAYAQGAGASGMTFLDSALPETLGEHLDGLLVTCVGIPDYTSRPGGRPGAPVAVRRVGPR